MLSWMLSHTRSLYLFQQPEAVPNWQKNKAFVLWLCGVGVALSTMAAASQGLFLAFAQTPVEFSSVFFESVVRHFFVGTLMVLLLESNRIATIACLMLAVNAAAVICAFALPWVGAPAGAAIALAFCAWSAAAFFKYRPASAATPIPASHPSKEARQ